MSNIYVNGSQEMRHALHTVSDFDINSRINRAMSNEAEAQEALTKALKSGKCTTLEVSALRIKRNIASKQLRNLQVYSYDK